MKPFQRKYLNIKKIEKSTCNFKFMTYNLLAQSKIKREIFPYSSKSALRKRPRHKIILNEIKQLNAHIMAFQEVEYYQEIFKRGLQISHSSVFLKCRTDGSSEHGCAIFWDKKMFILEEKVQIPFSEIKKEYEDEDIKREFGSYQVGQIVVLRFVEGNGAGIIVVNTHLYWNPFYEFVKLRQVHRILERLKGIREIYDYPVIFSGDFNSDPNSAVYKILVERLEADSFDFNEFLTPLIHYKHKSVNFNVLKKYDPKDFEEGTKRRSDGNLTPIESARIKESKKIFSEMKKLVPKLKSAYGSYKSLEKDISLQKQEFCAKNEPKYTNYTQNYKETLDYILIEESLHKKYKLELNKVLELPSDETLSAQTALPNDFYGSDHLALVAEICLCENK